MFRSIRFGLVLAAAAATLVFVAPAQAMTDQTFASSTPAYVDMIVIGSFDNDRAFDIAPFALFDEQPPAIAQRSYHVTKPLAIETHAFGAAVLATSKAGWGSGRLRKLAG